MGSAHGLPEQPIEVGKTFVNMPEDNDEKQDDPRKIWSEPPGCHHPKLSHRSVHPEAVKLEKIDEGRHPASSPLPVNAQEPTAARQYGEQPELAEDNNNSLSIHIRGLSREPVPQEADLRSFFEEEGCKVAGVRVVLDTNVKRGHPPRSRGFGLVDFEDASSLYLALTFHEKPAVGLATQNGYLRMETRARPDYTTVVRH